MTQIPVDPSLYERKVCCPVCDKNFTTFKVKTSGIQIDKRHADFSATYKGQNPTHYGVYVCPGCGYASFESVFHDINAAQIGELRKKVKPHWKGQNYCGMRDAETAIAVHKLALLSFNIIGASRFNIGKACLRLAWFYRAMDDAEKEKQFLHHAAENYEMALSTENVENANEQEFILFYTLGEIHRQLERYRQAIAYYDLVIKDEASMSRVKNMARDQRQLALEAYREDKKALKEA